MLYQYSAVRAVDVHVYMYNVNYVYVLYVHRYVFIYVQLTNAFAVLEFVSTDTVTVEAIVSVFASGTHRTGTSSTGTLINV